MRNLILPSPAVTLGVEAIKVRKVKATQRQILIFNDLLNLEIKLFQIIVPQWAFNRLAETLEEEENLQSKGHVILIQHTGRCGSTLLCQMFAKLPGTR